MIKWHSCSSSGLPSPNPPSFLKQYPTPSPAHQASRHWPLCSWRASSRASFLVTSCSWVKSTASAASVILVNAHINCLCVAIVISDTCMPHFSKAWKMTLLEWLGAARCFFIPGCFLASHLSASGAGWWGWGGWCRGTRQARVIVAPLSDWLTPQWAPPPSKRPLVSNSPPETVSGPTQPLVSAAVVSAPSPSYIKGARTWLERR